MFLATNATQKDVVLLISYSGTTAEIENEAKVLKRRKIPFILISSNKNCLAAQYADLLLLLPDAENNIQTLSTFFIANSNRLCFECAVCLYIQSSLLS